MTEAAKLYDCTEKHFSVYFGPKTNWENKHFIPFFRYLYNIEYKILDSEAWGGRTIHEFDQGNSYLKMKYILFFVGISDSAL